MDDELPEIATQGVNMIEIEAETLWGVGKFVVFLFLTCLTSLSVWFISFGYVVII